VRYVAGVLRVILDENNDIPIGGPTLASGVDSAASSLRAEFSTQTGEWPFDKTFGCPWRNAIFGKFFDSASTTSIIAAVANKTPDIAAVTANQITLDTVTNAAARQVDITIRNVLVNDDLVDLTLQTTF
jgi:hypothetical protein